MKNFSEANQRALHYEDAYKLQRAIDLRKTPDDESPDLSQDAFERLETHLMENIMFLGRSSYWLKYYRDMEKHPLERDEHLTA
ncbi:hypothetical protein GTQ99_00630 [Kineococcus sp. T13]|uniref:hypothetical protein n=1 Tax=Kineococcus vitellinus TaxID=2696565 RepID=UPI001412614B|nr:hypothetical protein [Kineococcus vitellinus]NAZ73937.1 hypothetical protein [Kineococcus vitellinus]